MANKPTIFDLKTLIIEATEKEFTPEEIGDEIVLFGPGTLLELDSLDALQISMAISKKYGISITDSKELRRAMINVRQLTLFIEERLI